MSDPSRRGSPYTLHIVPSTDPDRGRRRAQAAKLLLGIAAAAGDHDGDPSTPLAANSVPVSPPRAA